MTAPASPVTVCDDPGFRAAIRELVRAQGWGTARDVRVRVLKPHLRRCVFEVAVKTESGWRALIAKAYARDRQDILHAMEAFGQAGFGPDAEFSIPQPFAYLPALRMRLEEKVDGPSAKEILLRGDAPERRAAAARCGRWLARFQEAAPPRLGKLIDLGHEQRRWQEWTDKIAAFGEPLASRARVLLEKLEAATPAPGTFETCAAHGSYIAEHVIFSGRRTTAIDLDEYGAADPAREVSWFIISLQRLALKELGAFHALDAAADEFRRAYAAAARGRDVTAHSGFYRAVECLHRGARDVVGRQPPAPERTEIMLDQGLEAL
jgi:hypothetical protein